MNHEDYISNQIAVYKNSKTLIEFRDKLKVASLGCYAHIHADREETEDGFRRHSLIGILMKDYSKGTGDKMPKAMRRYPSCGSSGPRRTVKGRPASSPGLLKWRMGRESPRKMRTAALICSPILLSAKEKCLRT